MSSLEESLDWAFSPEAFSQLMAPLGPYPEDKEDSPIAVAVSGGADSMAMAFLLRRWRRHLIAFIIDHALREDSAEEASLTSERLQEMGIEAQVIRLAPLPSGCVQEKARDARFAALERACRQRGIEILCVAHHRADQEETLWMRYERQSDFLGMCGMARKVKRGCLMILRPLLQKDPKILRMILEKEGIEWCEDPSNQNRAFKRVQIRQDLKQEERDLMHLLSREARATLAQREEKFALLMESFIHIEPEGWARFSPLLWEEKTEDLLFLFKRLIRSLGGDIYPPAQDALLRLIGRGYGSLGRVIFKNTPKLKNDDIFIMREERGLSEKIPAHFAARWDRRWRYDGEELPSDYYIAALGEKVGSYRITKKIPKTVLATLPALWRAGELMAVPQEVRGLDRGLERCALFWDPAIFYQAERLVE